MSRTLKRPMFRKGGEVMEGIMTGIKPREMFRDKGMSEEMFKNVTAKRHHILLIMFFYFFRFSNFNTI